MVYGAPKIDSVVGIDIHLRLKNMTITVTKPMITFRRTSLNVWNFWRIQRMVLYRESCGPIYFLNHEANQWAETTQVKWKWNQMARTEKRNTQFDLKYFVITALIVMKSV